MNRIIATLALAAAVTAAAPASATDPTTRTVKLRYADLDLATRSGRAVLDRRVDAALERVCGSQGPTVNNEERKIAKCRAEAVARIARIAPRVAAARDGTQLASR